MSMAWVILISGVALMLFGTVMVGGWLSGKAAWFGIGVYDRVAGTKSDRWLLYVTFVALVLAPLLSGAFMILYGLRCFRKG